MQGSGGLGPRILNLHIRWEYFTIRPSYPQGKSECCSLHSGLGWPQCWSGLYGEYCLASAGNLNNILPVA